MPLAAPSPNLLNPPRYPAWAALLGVVLLAALIRCINLGSEPFWLDEINSVMVTMGHGYPTTLPTEPLTVQQWLETLLGWQPFSLDSTIAMLKTNVHLPLYYLLLHPWLTAFGLSEIALRGFAVLWSVALIPPTLALAGQTVTPNALPNHKPSFWYRTEVWAAILLIFNPFQLTYAQEGRMYTLALFFTALSGLSLWHITQTAEKTTENTTKKKSKLWWGLYGLSTLAGLFSHYIFWFQGLFHAAVWLRYIIRHWHQKQALMPLLLWSTVFILALVAWWPIFQIQQQAPTLSSGEHFFEGLLSPIRYLTMLFWEPWMVMTGSNIWAKIIYIPLTTVGIVLSGWAAFSKANQRPWIGFIAAWIWLPLLAIIAVDYAQSTHTSTIIRYGMLMAIPVMLLTSHGIAVGLYALRQRTALVSITATLITAILVIIGIGTVYPAQGPLHYKDKFPAKTMGHYAAQQCPKQTHQRLIAANGPLAAPLTLAYYMQHACPQQPLLYYVSPYREQPTPVPSQKLLSQYSQIWLFRYRGSKARGLNHLIKAIRTEFPKSKKIGPQHRWVIYHP